MRLRVLFLEDDSNIDIISRRLCRLYPDLVLEITALARDEVWNPNVGFAGRYIVSAKGLELARNASPELYDVVVVGNNMGTGLSLAQMLPEAMRERTLIVFNEYRPDIVFPYTELGFTRAGQRWRTEDETEIVSTIDFLIETVESLSKV